MTQLPDADFLGLQTALAGEYSLDREIGRGGMGIVYLAREVRLARPVAIKVLPPAMAQRPELRAAFIQEAQTVARLNHPNIVPVYAAGERGGFVYMVMAYVEGLTLGERIRTRGPLLPGQAARMLREVSWALAYAHAAGIVHRDVTAENILLERGTERAIVMDFGIASAMQTAAISDDGHVLGNAHYISPEQAVGEAVDARSDLYSLGICGYYALTAQLPFDADAPEKIVQQQLIRLPRPVASVAIAVPVKLGQAIDRCLEKEPARRFRSAESFAEAIDLAFEHAREIPAPLRVWIGQGERDQSVRLAFIGLATVAGASAVAITGHSWMFFQPFGLLVGGSFLPAAARLRRLLREGYGVEDIHVALRENALIRTEEIEYERATSSARMRRALWLVFGGSVAMGLYCSHQMREAALTTLSDPAMGAGTARGWLGGIVQSLSLLGFSATLLLRDYYRLRGGAGSASLSIALWKSKWGARIAKVVGLGVKPAARPVIGLPLLTETALGRATDHLYHALPKATRRSLGELPSVVKRLEQEASALRVQVNALDDQLVVFERRAAGSPERDQLERDVRDQRSMSVARLAATVGAIENIRLDLLRLHMGTAGVESVTAALEAAQRIGVELALATEANAEVERFLLAAEAERSPVQEEIAADDDADTPVGGVAAATPG